MAAFAIKHNRAFVVAPEKSNQFKKIKSNPHYFEELNKAIQKEKNNITIITEENTD